MEHIFAILPESLVQILQRFPHTLRSGIEEVRIRIDRPFEVIAHGKPYFPEANGKFYVVSKEDGRHILTQLSQYSLYAFEEELRQGYITLQGGHRVGLAGRVIVEDGKVKTLRNISSFNIRFARQAIGCAKSLVSHLYHHRWRNTLIIGPPQSGKTTLLRDLARLISTGVEQLKIPPFKVGIIDERSEIAASVNGIPQHELGFRVDVLDGCPKAEGMMMMIRSMSPNVLIVDELGREEDAIAFTEAIHAGVSIITTVHGSSMEDIRHRPAFRTLMEMKALDRCIELSSHRRVGEIKRIRDSFGKDVVNIA